MWCRVAKLKEGRVIIDDFARRDALRITGYNFIVVGVVMVGRSMKSEGEDNEDDDPSGCWRSL